MATLTLNAQSSAYPQIINRIEATIYNEADPLAVVASIIDSTSGHPSRYWNFLGLPRANYNFQLNEIDGDGNPINNLASFDVVPGNIDGTLTRKSEFLKVDTTPGLVSGTNTFVFDGTGTPVKPNYIGWTFDLFEVGGRAPLVLDEDYTYDETTGTFILIQANDKFQPNQDYCVIFNPIDNPMGGSLPTVIDFSCKLITADYTVVVADFGAKIIVEPASSTLTITLPDITTVVTGRVLMIEVGNPVPAAPSDEAMKCVSVVKTGTDVINFLRGNIYILPNEFLTIYKFKRADNVYEWRVFNYDGNFKTVGREVGLDDTSSWNVIAADGSILLNTQYGRLYNEYVLNLPIGQVCDYDSWSTGNNKYLFSLANSSDPSNVNKFRVPDRRGLFQKNTSSTGASGDYQLDALKAHDHTTHGAGAIPGIPSFFSRQTGNRRYSGGGGDSFGGSTNPDATMRTSSDGDTETRPKNVSVNRYFYV